MKLFENSQTKKGAVHKHRNADIAIVGIATRMPSADDTNVYWDMLVKGEDRIGAMTPKRREDAMQLFSEFGSQAGYVSEEGAYLNSIDEFDFNFFNIPFAQAQMMNPMHRLFLETMWHGVEDAGLTTKALSGSATGVYLAYSWNLNNYYWVANKQNPELAKISLTDNIASTLAGRVSYMLNLKGPSMVVDTACSSSMTALVVACNDIIAGNTDSAIVGGVNVTWGIRNAGLQGMGIESRSRRSKAFDQSADGIGTGEGVVVMILKPLSSAVRSGDRIWAVIKGAAMNNDGRSAGFTAPNAEAQKSVIIDAWKKSEVDPRQISFIETHGTGTKLGDPIEIEGITRAFRTVTADTQFCAIGSVKSNIGHLDAAAGVAGVAKAALALYHGQIPPHLHFDLPNENISLVSSPVYVARRLTALNASPRYCGVSSFGVSGTNCHLVMQNNEPVPRTTETDSGALFAFTISAKTTASLQALKESYEQFLQSTEAALEEICYASNLRREHFKYRMAMIGSSKEQLIQMLRGKFVNENGSGIYSTPEILLESGMHSSALAETQDDDRTSGLQKACLQFAEGSDVDWTIFYNGVPSYISMPLYPFEKHRCWPKMPDTNLKDKDTVMRNNDNMDSQALALANIKRRLVPFIADALTDNAGGEINEDESFFALGFDSVNIVYVRQIIAKEFKVDIPVEMLFDEVNTIRLLAAWLDKKVVSENVQQQPATVPSPVAAMEIGAPGHSAALPEQISVDNTDAISRLFDQQLAIMREQISFLKAGGGQQDTASVIKEGVVRKVAQPVAKTDQTERRLPIISKLSDSSGMFSEEQTEYLQKFIEKFSAKTVRSKVHTQRHRKQFASYRKSLYYDHFFKEITYPIFVESASGSHVVDIDGNEYIDFAMGFGVHLLGYNHPEITAAVREQVEKGIYIGPMSPKAGDVAKLICDITGAERAAFSNSGTESVMHCLRMARAATGKDKVVLFSNSYHGFFDGILAVADPAEADTNHPVSIGIPRSLIEDVIVLDYGEQHSLDKIRSIIGSLACVLVEPLQSRRPDFRAEQFLKDLRAITADADVALIFDEVITGFRIHPKGAAGFFGVEPDISAYGKVLGGGMPMGAMAGKARYFDLLDGGVWRFGDSSAPNSQRIATGGTFCHHPVSLASAFATLSLLKREGVAFYNALEEKTARLADELNHFFTTSQIPIKVVHCGSIFSFKPLQQVRSLHVLYFHLINRGIYLWQGATCFMSAAHTDDDVRKLIEVVKQACQDLVAIGLLQGKVAATGGFKISKGHDADISPQMFISPIQQRLLFMSLLHKTINVYNLPALYSTVEPVAQDALRESWKTVVSGYDGLRTVFDITDDNMRSHVLPYSEDVFGMEVVDFTDRKGDEAMIRKQCLEIMAIDFPVSKGPLLKARLTKFKDRSLILLNFNHLVADGISIEIILQELFTLYQSLLSGKTLHLPAVPFQYADYARSLNEYLDSQEGVAMAGYWRAKLSSIADRKILPYDFEHGTKIDSKGDYVLLTLSKEESDQIVLLAKKLDTTFFVIMLSAIKILVYKYCGGGVVSVGCPLSGRVTDELLNQLGCFVNSVVLLDLLDERDTVSSVVSKVRKTVLEAQKHQLYPFDRLVKELSPARQLSQNSLFEIDVNMNEQYAGKPFAGNASSGLEPLNISSGTTKFDITFSLFPPPSAAISIEFKTSLFEKGTIELLGSRLLEVIHQICASPDARLTHIKWISEKFAAGNGFQLQKETF